MNSCPVLSVGDGWSATVGWKRCESEISRSRIRPHAWSNPLLRYPSPPLADKHRGPVSPRVIRRARHEGHHGQPRDVPRIAHPEIPIRHGRHVGDGVHPGRPVVLVEGVGVAVSRSVIVIAALNGHDDPVVPDGGAVGAVGTVDAAVAAAVAADAAVAFSLGRRGERLDDASGRVESVYVCEEFSRTSFS